MVDLSDFTDVSLLVGQGYTTKELGIQEIADVENGLIGIDESPLRFAPHTVVDVAGEWTRKYSRSTALYPSVTGLARSYYPPVSRVDAASGDRNLVCSCAPLEQYADAHYQSS